ncbi:hypothetical protein D9M68_898390 [compost metagenome]
MAIIEDRDRCRIFRVIERPLRLMLPHHRNSFRPQCAAQPLQFTYQMRHVRDCIFKNERLQILWIGQCIVNSKPAAPGMAEKMHCTKTQRLTNRFGFLDIARDCP